MDLLVALLGDLAVRLTADGLKATFRHVDALAKTRGTTRSAVLAEAAVQARRRGAGEAALMAEYLEYTLSIPAWQRALMLVNPLSLVGPHTYLAWRARQRQQASAAG